MSVEAVPQVVVLVSADTEWKAVGSLFPQATVQPSPYGEWFLTELGVNRNSCPILFFHGGWGKIAAAGSTQYVIDRWQPGLLVNLGTCGGFEGEIERGTVVLAERTVVYDIIEQIGDYDEHIAHYTTDLDLSWLQREYPRPVRRTLLVSGDRDLLAEDIPQLKERLGAVAGDWESGSIAWVAKRNRVPCLILRGVTDLVSSKGGEAYGDFELFVRNTGRVMADLIDALPAWIAKSDLALVAK